MHQVFLRACRISGKDLISVTENNLFLQLADASPIGVYLVRDGRFVYVNPQFCLTTGYADEELEGRNCFALVIEEDRAKVRQSAVDMLKNGTREPYEYRVRCKDGSIRWILETVASVNYGGRATVGNFMDITERKLAEASLREKARRDPLTRLLNHGAFLEDLYTSFTSNPEMAHWLVMADVNGLKQVNDTYGHQMGDIVLRTVAAVIDRPGTIVGRYGGDEFIVLLVGGRREKAENYCEIVQDILAESKLADFRTKAKITPSVTMGIAGYPDDASSATALIRAADDAMFQMRTSVSLLEATTGQPVSPFRDREPSSRYVMSS
jgi:diguanylate cyclase (GGDEF)-like protein/PAS domain S-box-containing protein